MKKLEQLYEGKAKILYKTEDPGLIIQYFKDDATAFNAQKKGTIQGKGIVNNKISTKIFGYLESQGIPTHFEKMLSDREMLVKRVTIVPLEVIIRNVAAGSLSKRLDVPEGTILACPIFEFSYKNDALGDPLINEYHAIALRYATEEEIAAIKKFAFQINDLMKKFFATINVDLIDFKWNSENIKAKLF